MGGVKKVMVSGVNKVVVRGVKKLVIGGVNKVLGCKQRLVRAIRKVMVRR